jgi:hypothetical protein
VFSWYQKSGGPSAVVLTSDSSSKVYTLGTAVDGRHPEVNERGHYHLRQLRLACQRGVYCLSQRACVVSARMRSIGLHAER